MESRFSSVLIVLLGLVAIASLLMALLFTQTVARGGDTFFIGVFVVSILLILVVLAVRRALRS